MATILRFEPSSTRPTPRRGADGIPAKPAGPATILFFTGVRYERQPNGPVSTQPDGAPGPARVRRKRS